MNVVRAGGGIVRRPNRDEVLVVHRPKYDDWSLPKGKVDGDETDEECALREVEEETGFQVRLGAEAGSTSYTDSQGRPKKVRYWEMVIESGEFTPNREVDEIRWLDQAAAERLLTYDHDRALLRQSAARSH